MLEKLNPREKRTVIICVAACGLMLLYFLVVEPVASNWKKVRSRLTVARQKASMLSMDPKNPETQRQKRLLEIVPVLEMPKASEQQGPLFQETFTEQLKKAGLNSRRLQLVLGRASKTDAAGYVVQNVQSQGSGSYEQILKLIADLPQNSYYAGIQKLSMKADPKNRQNLDWEITVFTYATR